VRKTQRIPFNTTRASRHGRPRPSGRRFGVNSGFNFFHCASIRSMYSIYASLKPTSSEWLACVYEITSRFLAARYIVG
jgi:hypothetical protein